MLPRPVTTLFLLMSVDGKISTGSTDALDVDRDYPNIPGVREGLHQYYEIEQTMDAWSFNSGRVMRKVGMNERALPAEKLPCSFVLLDNAPHLTEQGVRYLSAWLEQLVIVTSNSAHPAYSTPADNVRVLYQETFDPAAMLRTLYEECGVQRLTIQSGGTLNALFLRQKLLDYIDIVIAPALIGGKNTATLIDGASLTSLAELGGIGALELTACEALADSYVRLRYRVVG